MIKSACNLNYASHVKVIMSAMPAVPPVYEALIADFPHVTTFQPSYP